MIVGLVLTLVTSCSQQGSGRPPEYIKEFVVYQEGADGVVAYFILADAYGQVTAWDGVPTLRIFGPYDLISSGQPVYERRVQVNKTNFYSTTVGRGAFARKTVLASFGRIKTSEFRTPLYRGEGKVLLVFETAQGQHLDYRVDFRLR